MYEVELEFPGVGALIKNPFHWGEVWIFYGTIAMKLKLTFSYLFFEITLTWMLNPFLQIFQLLEEFEKLTINLFDNGHKKNNGNRSGKIIFLFQFLSD